MIPHDFIYCRPDSLSDAAAAFDQLQSEGRRPMYYGGGSEIITLCRAGAIRPGAVIDLKSIPDCLALELRSDRLVIGAANSLNTIGESRLFPLLGKACGRIADHTNQCRITLGGNLCGTILYREACLPLLLSDAEAVLYGPQGMRTAAFQEVFRERMRLSAGELVAQVHVPAWALGAPYFHIKKTAQEKIDYPLVSVSALGKGTQLRAAFSGLCPFPFRSKRIERVLNDRKVPAAQRVSAVKALLPAPAYSDAEGSGEYRLSVLEKTLRNLLEEWEYGAV